MRSLIRNRDEKAIFKTIEAIGEATFNSIEGEFDRFITIFSPNDFTEQILTTILQIDSGIVRLEKGLDGRPFLSKVNNPKPASDNGEGFPYETMVGLVEEYAEIIHKKMKSRIIKKLSPEEFNKFFTIKKNKTELNLFHFISCHYCSDKNEINTKQVEKLFFICNSCNSLNLLCLCPSCEDAIIYDVNTKPFCKKCNMHILYKAKRTGKLLRYKKELDASEDIAKNAELDEKGKQIWTKYSKSINELYNVLKKEQEAYKGFVKAIVNLLANLSFGEETYIFLDKWHMAPKEILKIKDVEKRQRNLVPLVEERIQNESFGDEFFELYYKHNESPIEEEDDKANRQLSPEDLEALWTIFKENIQQVSFTEFPISFNKLYDISNKIGRYQEQQLTIDWIKQWLLQFPSRDISLAFDILTKFEYFNESYCMDLLLSAYHKATRWLLMSGFQRESLPEQLRKMDESEYFKTYEKKIRQYWYFTGLDINPITSESFALRLLRRATELHTYSVEETLEFTYKTQPIIAFADLFSGSGSQVLELYKTMATKLDYSSEVLAKGPRILLLSTATKEAIRNIRKQTKDTLKVFCGKELKKTDRAFHPNSKFWKGREDERIKAKELAEKIGMQLESNDPLGYKNSELLIAFFHNCPNNTLPIIWKKGKVDGKPWFPLLIRR